jgi:hypothetical protein
MKYAFLCLLCACSTPNPSDDGGVDASGSDVVATDSPAQDAPSDGSSCNVTASATITGTFLGKTLTPQDEIAFQAHTTQYETVVGITDYKGACGLGNDVKANSNVLAIVYQGSTPLVPATIDVAQTNTMSIQFTEFDGTCQSPAGESASSGKITFTQVDDCAVTGSFDLVFNSDHVTGTFAAPVCAAAPDGGTSNCK